MHTTTTGAWSAAAAPRWRAAVLALATLAAGLLLGAATEATDARRAGAYPLGDGYWLAATDGGIFAYGDAQFYGSTGNIRLNQPIVAMASHPFLEGYWFAATDGGVFNFGSSGFHGSAGSLPLEAPVTAMTAHPSGEGYWLAATDGGIFAYGAAGFFGSQGGKPLNSPIVGMAATPTGKGYWLVAADGGIFAYGDATFHGSMGDKPLNKPIVGIAATPTGKGYWLVATDGGIFTFGDAGFHGSTGAIRLNKPVVGMTSSPDGAGYLLVATDGGVFRFGDATFFGSAGNIRLNQPIIGIAQRPRHAVSADAFSADGDSTTRWTQVGADWQLSLANTGTAGAPAGAKILGVEGLDLGQLGTVKVALEGAASCASGPSMVIYVDTTGDRKADSSRSLTCSQLVAGTNPVTATGLPASTWVGGADLVYGDVGSVSVDDIRVAGLTIVDFHPARA